MSSFSNRFFADRTQHCAGLAILLAASLVVACSGEDNDEFSATDTGDADTTDAGADSTNDTGVDALTCGDGVVNGTEECDGDALADATCTSLGLEAGELTCSSDCTFDRSACGTTELCGNGTVDGTEECDGDDLNGQDCSDSGFALGALSCADDCTLDLTACRTAAVCGDGLQEGTEECDDGNTADADGCASDCVSEICGDGIVQSELGEECDTGSTVVTTCEDHPDRPVGLAFCSADCTFEEVECTDPARCGDGTLDFGEACDDGGTDPGDGCDAECASETCENDVLDDYEACDGDDFGGASCDDFGFNDGALSCDGCAVSVEGCFNAVCGDGELAGPEQCDDGNRESGDGCSRRCVLEFCGDGVVDENEACDEGENNGSDTCRLDCTVPTCGDEIVDVDEGCDEGAGNGGSTCREDCTAIVCGDEILDLGEECDDGASNGASSCRTDCTLSVCGDEIVDEVTGEQCDAGLSGDANCRPNCTLIACGDGIPDSGEDCDEGTDNGSATCRLDCTVPVCGDEIVDTLSGEECDIGAAAPTSECRSDCTEPVCGDGVIDESLGEECDDGNADETDGCTSSCENAVVAGTPTAVADIQPVAGSPIHTMSYDGRASFDDDGTIVAYEWDFGDGRPAGSGARTMHTYELAGSYDVTLTVTDDDDLTDSVVVPITVVTPPPAPTARFTVDRTTACAPFTVQFDASTSSGDMITDYDWNFDGTATGMGASPSFTYSSPGTYAPMLTVTTAAMTTDSTSTPITVLEDPIGEVVWISGSTTSPTSWNDPSNWCPARAPTVTDIVRIPTPVLMDSPMPVLSNGRTVAGLIVEQRASIDGGAQLPVMGDVVVDGHVDPTVVIGADANVSGYDSFGSTAGFRDLRIEADVTASGRIDAYNIVIDGAAASIDVGPNRVAAFFDATLSNDARVFMNDPAGSFFATDLALGGQVIGTAGSLDFTNLEVSTEDPPLVSSGTHRASITGSPTTLELRSSGAAPPIQFNNLIIATGGAVTLDDPLHVNGVLSVFATGTITSTAGAFLEGNFTLNDGSRWNVDTTLEGDGQTIPISWNGDLTVLGELVLNQLLTVGGDILVTGADASLDLNGNELRSHNGFEIRFDDGATLIMDQPEDFVFANGPFVYGGAETNLTAGTLRIDDSFEQLDTGNANSFVASGTHVTELNGDSGCDIIGGAGPTLAQFGSVEFETVGGPRNCTCDTMHASELTVGTSIDLACTGHVIVEGLVLGTGAVAAEPLEIRAAAVPLNRSYGGTVQFTGNVTGAADNFPFLGDVEFLSGSTFDPNGFILSAQGDVTFLEGSSYQSFDSRSSLAVTGAFTYGGLSTGATFTDGTLTLRGDFVQTSSMLSADAFEMTSSLYLTLLGPGPHHIFGTGDARTAQLPIVTPIGTADVTIETHTNMGMLDIGGGSSVTLNAAVFADQILVTDGTLVMNGQGVTATSVVVAAGSTLDNQIPGTFLCESLTIQPGATVLGEVPVCGG